MSIDMYIMHIFLFCSLLVKDENLPTNPSPAQERFAECQDTLNLESSSHNVSDDCYKTRNRLLDNVSVQSFEETLYLEASNQTKPLTSSEDSSHSEKVENKITDTGESSDQQVVEQQVIKIAQEW